MNPIESSVAKVAVLVGLLTCVSVCVQYVAAQTATSTGSTASVTTAVSTSTNATSTQATSTQVVASSTSSILEKVAALENAYKKAHGKYLQILANNQLPSYETGTVAGKLGKNIPNNVKVDIYQAPIGDGYQVTYQAADGTISSLGAGPEAGHRTYTILPPATTTATSTSH